MFKKMILLILAGFSLTAAPSGAFWKDDSITMLVVPREVIPLQIAQDISRRYPVLIVSYQATPGKLRLHAWNGEEWVFVPTEDYVSGTFFANRPSHAILIESEHLPAPDVLIPDSLWCPTANRLVSSDPRVIIHLLGRYFDFPFRHWNRFAERYGYALEEINPALVNVHWWNLRGDVFLRKRANRVFFVDEDRWFYQETIQPPPPVPEFPMEEPAAPEAPAVEPVRVIEVAPAGSPEPEPPAEPQIAPVPDDVSATAPEAVFPDTDAVQVTSVEEVVRALQTAMEPKLPPVEDPFLLEEIPAAEIVLPEQPKKSWWKIF